MAEVGIHVPGNDFKRPAAQCVEPGCTNAKRRGKGSRRCDECYVPPEVYHRNPPKPANPCQKEGCSNLKVRGYGGKYCAEHRPPPYIPKGRHRPVTDPMQCTTCLGVKPLSEFKKPQGPQNRQRHQCRACMRSKRREWENGPGRAAHLAIKSRQQRKALYRLTQEQYDAMIEAQGGLCAICGADKPGGRGAWHVDHDHACCPGIKSCGKCVRGLLCQQCNARLGHRENFAWHRLADPYIARYAERKVAHLAH